MRIINGKKYNERKDLQTKIFGLEQYAAGKNGVGNLFIQMTSGTTGGGPAIFVMRYVLNNVLRSFYDYRKPLLVISTKNSSALRKAQTILTHSVKPTRILFLNKKDTEHPLISSVIDDFEPQVIHTNISILNFFIDSLHGKKIGSFNRKITKVHIGGEVPPMEFLKKLTAVFPKSKVARHYGASELGTIGINCRHLAKKYRNKDFQVFHPIKRVSVIDQDSSGVGEIAVFSPTLANYATGDAGKIVREKCTCGAGKTLMLYGRINYDIINCVGATFHILEVERVFSPLNRYVADYYLEIKEIFGRGKTIGSFTVKLVPTEKLRGMKSGKDFISDFLKKHLQLTKTRRLNDLINSGIFLPPKIMFVPSLPGTGKKIRMKKVHD